MPASRWIAFAARFVALEAISGTAIVAAAPFVLLGADLAVVGVVSWDIGQDVGPHLAASMAAALEAHQTQTHAIAVAAAAGSPGPQCHQD